MNHPSDYMVDYTDSQSSDSSNPHIVLQKPTNHTSHKNKSQISLIKPEKKEHGKQKSKKKAKPKPPKNTVKKKKKNGKEKQSKYDIFVYGGSFYSCGSIDEVSCRFKRNLQPKLDQKVMLEHRLRRKEQRCIQKIQKYLKGFLVANSTKNVKIAASQKLELYFILKKEQQKQQEQNLIEQVLKKSLETLQQKCERLAFIYPTQHQLISRWKNVKMHQLMTAQYFLRKEDQPNLDIFDLNNELSLLNEEEFFPEMRQEAHQLQQQIINHLQSRQIRENIKLQDQTVIQVLNRFLTFTQQREDIWSLIAQQMQQYQYGNKSRPLIDNQIYIQFQKTYIGQDQQQQQEEEDQSSKVYRHVFNKAVIDLINEAALQFHDIYPAIQCLRNIICEAKTMLIAEQLSELHKDRLLEIDALIFEQLLGDALTDVLDFL